MTQTFNKIVYASLLAAGVLSSSVVLAKTQVSSTAQMAQMSKREQLIRQILKAQHFSDMYEQTMIPMKEMIQTQAQQMLTLSAQAAGLGSDQIPPSLQEKLVQFVQKAVSELSGAEFESLYASFYGKGLTDKDLESVLKYYQSPIGQKEAKSNVMITAAFTQATQALMQQKAMESMSRFVDDMKKEIDDYKKQNQSVPLAQ
jgi:hypothetical protein